MNGLFPFCLFGYGRGEKRPCSDVASSSNSAPISGYRTVRRRLYRRTNALALLPEYLDCGHSDFVCDYYGAFFWFGERYLKLSTVQHLRNHRCCRGGLVVLPYPSRMSHEFIALFHDDRFLRDIRAYNSMLCMTSFGANVDDHVNDSHGPFVFKISGQISHKIGSLCPDP
uniref:Uncharacterized protein n=1 Tax=Lactuca sativa TaxID=4236 RepID=A0A9R1VN26_LACSA|nr:hypothetical protein LSAT_V11C400192000 [Lactuca sativa]